MYMTEIEFCFVFKMLIILGDFYVP